MKRIALVITRMIGGGASRVVLQIINGLRGEFDFTLFTGIEDLSGSEIKELSEKYKTIFIPSLVRRISPLNDLKAFLELRRYFIKMEFDIVHTHTSKAGVIGRFAAKKAGIKKIIHSTHGTIYQTGSKIPGVPDTGGIKKILLFIEKKCSQLTDYQIVLSRAEAELSLKLGLSEPDNTLIIPNGIDLKCFEFSNSERETKRKSFGFNSDETIILCVGRLSSEKGQSVLIDAFKELFNQKSNLKAKLLFVGDGSDRRELEDRAGDLLRQGKIIFFGYDPEPQKYLAAADIFVMPSMYEGFGLALLEAMAAEVPCIASSVGGVPEIIQDGVNGILFRKGNANNLKEKLIYLISNPEFAKIMAQNAKSSVKKYDLDFILSEYLKIYKQDEKI